MANHTNSPGVRVGFQENTGKPLISVAEGRIEKVVKNAENNIKQLWPKV